MREPDFNNMEKVLAKECPSRPTLFEFFLNERLYRKLAGDLPQTGNPFRDACRQRTRAFSAADYDYVTFAASEFHFVRPVRSQGKSISQNEGALVTDRASFDKYKWLDPDAFADSHLEDLASELPGKMKIICCGPGGVLENAMEVVGFDNLCMMLHDDPGLVSDVFENIGSRLVRYYERASRHDSVGALISNDDWGFKTQTMLAPDDMRKYVFPWHKEIAGVIHKAGKPVLLHSCGQLEGVMEDVITDMKYDGKHSFEDSIMPVEDAYEKYVGRIAILGGIGLDFICRATPDEIRKRSLAMLERAAVRGGYALGTGNSVPEYVPDENYMAMISAV